MSRSPFSQGCLFAAAASVVLVLSFAQPAFAAPDTHVAFAYGVTDRIVSHGAGPDVSSAQEAAEAACRQQGGGVDCQAVGWWRKGTGSFAVGPRNDSPTRWGWGTDPDIAIADQKALQYCGQGCRLTHRLGIYGETTYAWGNLSPVRGKYKTVGYLPGAGDHTGRDRYAVDFTTDAPAVYPVHGGKIVFSGYNCDTNPPGGKVCYGYVIAIDHGSGLYSIYTHLADAGRAAESASVNSATRIGTMSSTGCPTKICGPDHLHFAMRKGNVGLSGRDALFHPSLTSVRTPWR
jgi:murein DD-endopeptidase MepM/ murein hydrolase activator NlpD